MQIKLFTQISEGQGYIYSQVFVSIGFKTNGLLSAHWHTSSVHSVETSLLLWGAEQNTVHFTSARKAQRVNTFLVSETIKLTLQTIRKYQIKIYLVHNNRRIQLEQAAEGRLVLSVEHRNECIPLNRRAGVREEIFKYQTCKFVVYGNEFKPYLIKVDQHSSMGDLIMGNISFRFRFQLQRNKNQTF